MCRLYKIYLFFILFGLSKEVYANINEIAAGTVPQETDSES